MVVAEEQEVPSAKNAVVAQMIDMMRLDIHLPMFSTG